MSYWKKDKTTILLIFIDMILSLWAMIQKH